MPGTILIAATVAALVLMSLPEAELPSIDFARSEEPPFAVPKRAIPIPVHPALVHPGWCQPADAPICLEI